MAPMMGFLVANTRHSLTCAIRVRPRPGRPSHFRTNNLLAARCCRERCEGEHERRLRGEKRRQVQVLQERAESGRGLLQLVSSLWEHLPAKEEAGGRRQAAASRAPATAEEEA